MSGPVRGRGDRRGAADESVCGRCGRAPKATPAPIPLSSEERVALDALRRLMALGVWPPAG